MTQESNIAPAINPIVQAMSNYANYNLWANTTMINWLKTKPADVLEQEVLSSFKGVKPTLVHIWQTQCYWLTVINRTPFTPVEFTGTIHELFDEVIQQSTSLARFVESLSHEALQENTLIKNQWFECNYPNFEYVIQVMNHSTYHRGQIITMGHHLGFIDAPMTDYNYYNVMGKQAETTHN